MTIISLPHWIWLRSSKNINLTAFRTENRFHSKIIQIYFMSFHFFILIIILKIDFIFIWTIIIYFPFNSKGLIIAFKWSKQTPAKKPNICFCLKYDSIEPINVHSKRCICDKCFKSFPNLRAHFLAEHQDSNIIIILDSLIFKCFNIRVLN